MDAAGSLQPLLHIRQSGPPCEPIDGDYVAAIEGITDFSVGKLSRD